jgi:hypothetical protein
MVELHIFVRSASGNCPLGRWHRRVHAYRPRQKPHVLNPLTGSYPYPRTKVCPFITFNVFRTSASCGAHGRRSSRPYDPGHALITAALDAGLPPAVRARGGLACRPSTPMRYDRARASLDHHATCVVAAFLSVPPDRRHARPSDQGRPVGRDSRTRVSGRTAWSRGYSPFGRAGGKAALRRGMLRINCSVSWPQSVDSTEALVERCGMAARDDTEAVWIVRKGNPSRGAQRSSGPTPLA